MRTRRGQIESPRTSQMEMGAGAMLMGARERARRKGFAGRWPLHMAPEEKRAEASGKYARVRPRIDVWICSSGWR